MFRRTLEMDGNAPWTRTGTRTVWIPLSTQAWLGLISDFTIRCLDSVPSRMSILSLLKGPFMGFLPFLMLTSVEAQCNSASLGRVLSQAVSNALRAASLEVLGVRCHSLALFKVKSSLWHLPSRFGFAWVTVQEWERHCDCSDARSL